MNAPANRPESGALRSHRFYKGTRAELRRFLRFLAVGACSFIVETSALTGLVFLLGVNRVLAKALAFALAVLTSFLGNYFWAYRDSRSKSLATQGLQFATVSIGGLAVNLLVFSSVDWAFRDRILTASTSLYVAHMAAVGAALFWNFAINRVVTYNDVRLGR